MLLLLMRLLSISFPLTLFLTLTLHAQNKNNIEIESSVTIGNDQRNNPPEGTIRWNPMTADFEGYNGNEWLSLTKANRWGRNISLENQKFDNFGLKNGFGAAVDVSGDWAIVGYFNDSQNGEQSGSASIFELVNGVWLLRETLYAPNPQAYDRFGFSVSIDGDYAIVGAPQSTLNQNSKRGKAYVFYNFLGTWIQPDILTPSNSNDNDSFGRSVSNSGNYVIVGASGDSEFTQRSGAAYIFKKAQVGNQFSQTAKLKTSFVDANTGDFFGSSVDMDGTRVVIGAPGDGENGENAGASYIYERSIGENWSRIAKLLVQEPVVDQSFGTSVALSGDDALIGSLLGGCYIFSKSFLFQWDQQAELVSPNGTFDYSFGDEVHLDGNIAIVGAPGENGQEISEGAVYLFERVGTTWQNISQLKPTDLKQSGFFGTAVAIDQESVLVGATGGGRADKGAFYYFRQE